MKAARWIKLCIGVITVVLVFSLVDLNELWQTLQSLTLLSVVYLVALGVIMIWLSAFKWKLFLDRLGKDPAPDDAAGKAEVSVMRLFNLYMIGYFVNLLFPSYVGGDALRSWFVGRRIGQHEAMAATVLERYTGMVAMVSLASIFMWMARGVTFEIRCVVGLFALGLAAITIAALSERLLGLLERCGPLRVTVGHLRKVQATFHLARSRPGMLAGAVGLSFIYHSLTVLNTFAAAYAVGWFQPDVLQLFVVLPLILLIGALPITPQGLGIQEGAFYFFLQTAGATPAQALGVAVVLRAKSYLLALWGGVVWWYLAPSSLRRSEAAPAGRRDARCASD